MLDRKFEEAKRDGRYIDLTEPGVDSSLGVENEQQQRDRELKEQPNEDQKGTCPICQSDEGDEPLDAFCDECRAGPRHIKHYMHTRCLKEYLSYGQNVCPVCKSSPCKPWQMVNELVNDAGPQVHDDAYEQFNDGMW